MRISDWSSDVCSSDLYLVGSVDLAGTDGLDHVGHRVQGHRARAAGVDDQVADVVDRAAVRGLRAHQHVDLAVAEAVAGGDLAPHLLHHHVGDLARGQRSEEHTSELQSLMRISYAGFCLKKKKQQYRII